MTLEHSHSQKSAKLCFSIFKNFLLLHENLTKLIGSLDWTLNVKFFFNKTGFTQLWAKLGFFLPSNTACFKPELQIYLFDKLKFLFFCRFVIVHRIITKLIGLVYLFSKIHLIFKKIYVSPLLWPFGSNSAPKNGLF